MRSTRRPLNLLLGILLFAAALLGLAAPASAHDAAEGSSPANGAAVASVPAKVSVTFNNNPLGLGASFSVKDASGTEWADGAVQIVDNVASQTLRTGAPAGAYTVSWRVVSSDSHPIEGTFSFTASAGSEGSTTPAGSAAPAATGPASGAAPAEGTVPTLGTAGPGSPGTSEPVAASAEPFPWSIVGFAVVALGLLVALGVTARRRLKSGEEPE